LTTDKDYSESVDALGRAINVLKQQNFDRKQAAAMLAQVRGNWRKERDMLGFRSLRMWRCYDVEVLGCGDVTM
jgi:hypothetical protein